MNHDLGFTDVKSHNSRPNMTELLRQQKKGKDVQCSLTFSVDFQSN